MRRSGQLCLLQFFVKMKSSNVWRLLGIGMFLIIAAISGFLSCRGVGLVKLLKEQQLKFNTSDGLSEDAARSGMNATHNITQEPSVNEKHIQKAGKRCGYSSKFQPDLAVNCLEKNDDQLFNLKFNTSDGLSEDAAGIGKNGTHNIIQKRSVQDKDFQEMLPGYSSDFEPDEAANSLEENDDQPFNCSSNYGYFPDPKGNCSVYYSCRDGLPEKRVCTNGTLHFNPVSGVCDYPEFALCKRECPGRNGAFPVLGFCHKYLDCIDGQGRYVDCPPDQHFNAITKLCDNPSRAACEVTCPSYDTLMPLPGRCEMYASCKEGKPTYHLCPRGLHFNPIHLYCDYPGQSGCHIQQQCYASEGFFPVLGQCGSFLECHNYHAEVHSCSSGLHFNFLLHTCDVPTTPACHLTCKEPNGFFPFPGVCAFYIRCIKGIPSLHKCPGELEFNEVLGHCDVTPQNHCKPQCPKEDGAFPVPNHCGIFLQCNRGVPSVKRCSPNMHFNGITGRCDTPERAKCMPACEHSSGVFPFPGRCGMYYRCDDYVATVLSCIKGLHFNARTLVCDWPESAHCELECPKLSGYYPIQATCSSYLKCDHGRPKLVTCADGEHFNYETKRCGTPENANCQPSCINGDGMFPVPGHCDSYIRCHDRKPYITTCPDGLLFNRVLGVCDLAENVFC